MSSEIDTKQTAALRLFISGDRSQVGKSTCCLGLLGSLLDIGYDAKEIAYIKPATQCEMPQLVTKFCAARGIEMMPIGPIVFYSGFTRAFLAGEVGTSEDLLVSVEEAVDRLARGKKLVVIDGVGYPAVGSICGVSNADIAARVKAPVLLIGKKGVGDAVDSYNLNATFFKAHGVRVLGGLFNRLPLEGYYSLDKCKTAIGSYFSLYRPNEKCYGMIPEVKELVNASAAPSAPSTNQKKVSNAEEARAAAASATLSKEDEKKASSAIALFSTHIDVKQIVKDASQATTTATTITATPNRSTSGPSSLSSSAKTPTVPGNARARIQAEAEKSGASGG